MTNGNKAAVFYGRQDMRIEQREIPALGPEGSDTPRSLPGVERITAG